MKSFFHFTIYVFATLFFISSSLSMSLVGAIFISTAVLGYGIYRLNINKFDSAAVMSVGLIMNSLFYFLAVYLADYFKPFAIIITVAGAFISFVVMFFYYFWKQGKKRVEFIVKQEQLDIYKKVTLRERISNFFKKISDMRSIHARAKEIQSTGLAKRFSYQQAYVEHVRKEAWTAPKNAIDFAILKEVQLNRNEYSGEDGKRRIL